ncbi:hypothetical protein [Legionella bononiensis]|uniref:Uncharacterized protein n=1 Tax=Legionella bononiensis TaxID=2793102 RepID=A0ABS1WDH3_9GAMM|nr:hypothetical protein [Legionella bononiensis]MBL7481371.1 hypothetical protein [Legionella bononiensis]MBL7527403.1 hypothetical protein [Legionella bononiensis]
MNKTWTQSFAVLNHVTIHKHTLIKQSTTPQLAFIQSHFTHNSTLKN